VPITLKRSDRTQPDAILPVLGFEYITEDQPSRAGLMRRASFD